MSNKHSSACVLRKIACVICAVLFCLAFVLTAVSAAFCAAFSDRDAFAERVVNDAYLDAARTSFRQETVNTVLLYDLEEDLLSDAFEESDPRSHAVASLQRIWDLLVNGERVELSPYPEETFRQALDGFIAEKKAENPDLTVDEAAVNAILSDCTSAAASAATPLESTYDLLSRAVEKIPAGLVSSLPLIAAGLGVLSLLLGVGVFFSAQKKYRLYDLFGTLFCASALVFVPSLLLLGDQLTARLPLSRGLLWEITHAAADSVYLALRIFSVTAFVLSTAGLILSVVLLCRQAEKAPPASAPEETAEN